MKSQLWGIGLLGVALLAGQAQASLINFDNLTPGCTPPAPAGCAAPAGAQVVQVNSQYFLSDGVTFSALDPGGPTLVVLVESGTGYNDSKPNDISLGLSSGQILYPQTGQLILTFQTPALNLNFDVYGNDSAYPAAGAAFAVADIYENNSPSVTATFNLMTQSCAVAPCNLNGINTDHQDLSAFPNITKLVIRNDTDVNGSAFDNFSFSAAAPSVPEPSTLLLTGLCGIVWVGRRFLARQRM